MMRRQAGGSGMSQLQKLSLWVAGALALLSMLNIVVLTFNILFVRIDLALLAVAIICFANAYYGSR
jgi:hypothetical protein